MRQLVRIAAFVLGLSAIFPLYAEATPIVDQVFAPSSSSAIPAGLGQAAQTFTVGVSGTLVQIDVAAWLNPLGLDFPLLFDLRPVDGSGVPLNDPSTALVQRTIPRASVPTNQTPTPDQFVAVNLGLGVPVTAGDQFAIVLNGATGGSYGVFANSGDGYAGGDYFWNFQTGLWELRSGADFGFRTWIESATTVAEPSTLLLIVTSVASVVLSRRNRRRH